MSIANEQWLKATNEFALLGIKFLYISNAGAIIAILSNIHHLTHHPNYPVVACALTMFVGGIISSLAANFFGYLLYRDLLISKQNERSSRCECLFTGLAIIAALLSIFFFASGAFKAIAIIG